MTFQHKVVVVTMTGEHELSRFWVKRSFGKTAMWKFRDAAQDCECLHYVRDGSVAGRHYRNDDGSKVIELR